MNPLTLVELKNSAKEFVGELNSRCIPNLYGVTDGKAVGTYVEQAFNQYHRILEQPPEIGYLTISNALQWRLQYRRVIDLATSNNTTGVENILV
ncbi:MAG: hypothetical protein QNJ38_09690 [Prochloraceae cyanobacterium]|nr:hypothetical protein [Prochloraceae cyanobacterium]